MYRDAYHIVKFLLIPSLNNNNNINNNKNNTKKEKNNKQEFILMFAVDSVLTGDHICM